MHISYAILLYHYAKRDDAQAWYMRLLPHPPEHHGDLGPFWALFGGLNRFFPEFKRVEFERRDN